ncbi:MAG TPA: PsiF family protein [Caldimonas sp.]|nr:PsiF family protein [Caldimonas sp.]
MKKLMTMLASAAAGAQAADAAQHKTPQQEKMAACNKEPEGKKGVERKAFMSTCLSSKTADAKSAAQHEKTKSCSGQAAGKKGDEHETFMKDCLSHQA